MPIESVRRTESFSEINFIFFSWGPHAIDFYMVGIHDISFFGISKRNYWSQIEVEKLMEARICIEKMR